MQTIHVTQVLYTTKKNNVCFHPSHSISHRTIAYLIRARTTFGENYWNRKGFPMFLATARWFLLIRSRGYKMCLRCDVYVVHGIYNFNFIIFLIDPRRLLLSKRRVYLAEWYGASAKIFGPGWHLIARRIACESDRRDTSFRYTHREHDVIVPFGFDTLWNLVRYARHILFVCIKGLQVGKNDRPWYVVHRRRCYLEMENSRESNCEQIGSIRKQCLRIYINYWL